MTNIIQPAQQKSADYSAIVVVTAITVEFETAKMFDDKSKPSKGSAVDEFLENANRLNLIWINQTDVSQELANIAFLGYMSAMESYVRALVRRLINEDPFSAKAAEARPITFGAALHHTKALLPEALMDEFSFTKMENIRETFKSLLGLDLSLDERTVRVFDRICQLRHCCVHRFGKLGAKNAMVLGLENHGALFEKTLSLTKAQLMDIAANLRTVAKSINNSVYRAVMDRTYPIPKNKEARKEMTRTNTQIIWKGDYENDRVQYAKYYNLFATKVDSQKSPGQKEMYNRFITQKNSELLKSQPSTSVAPQGAAAAVAAPPVSAPTAA